MVADRLGPDTQLGVAVAGPATLPRLLDGIGGHPGAVPLAEHRSRYPAPGRPLDGFVAAVEWSGLRGRGGASFPTGTKLRAVRDGHRTPVVVVVVVNGSEGEPASGKDELLLATVPHLVPAPDPGGATRRR